MRTFRFIITVFATIYFFGAINLHAEQAAYPSTEEELFAEIQSLPWEFESGTYSLAFSNSTLRLPENLALIRGEYARRYHFLNHGIEFPLLEAIMVNYDTEEFVNFEYGDVGYVTLDDWEEVDAEELLEHMVEEGEKANKERRKNGLPSVKTKGWVKKPTLMRNNNSVIWAIETIQSGDHYINEITLNLGRRGFERITRVGTLEQYYNQSETTEALIDGHEFDSGYKFADYSSGDKLAGFGIASLVAVSAGAGTRTGKGILASLAKFIWVPIVAAIGGLWAFFRGKSKRRKQTNKGGKKNYVPPNE